MAEPDAELIAALGRLNLQADETAIQPLRGVNSRIWLVDHATGPLIAKRYFRAGADDRDRLAAEWAFVNHAVKLGLTCIPRPIARDSDSGVAIYEFVPGRQLRAGEVGPEQVAAAARFFLALNGVAARALANDLPAGAEACFTLSDHIDLVEARIDRLCIIDADASPLDRAAAFLVQRLRAQWRTAKAGAIAAAEARGWALTAPLGAAERCVSPSDFGFHNAILRPDGSLCFIDFEYAGWDDPAKMVADFFCQPAVPVPLAEFEPFLALTMQFAPDPASLAERARLLLPVLRIKWCCIMLNAFLPEHARRRSFADPQRDLPALKSSQLEKAQAAVAALASF